MKTNFACTVLILISMILETSCASLATKPLPTSRPTVLSQESLALDISTLSPSGTPTISSNLVQMPSETPKISMTPSSPSSNDPCRGTQLDFSKANASGKFVLSGDYDTYLPKLALHHSPSYILAPGTGEKITLPINEGDEIKNFSVSPNKQWLAYFTKSINGTGGANNRLVIVDNNGNKFKEYSEANWWGLLYWLDDNHLLISKLARENPFPIVVLDPFDNKQTELQPNFPEIYSGAPWMPFWENIASAETVYNSNLSFVIYPKSPNKIVLWDINTRKIVTEISDPGASSSAPSWFLDGESFVIDVATHFDVDNPYYEEVISVGIDGSIKQLTNLVDEYGTSDIRQSSESPNGRYIAFWFRPVADPSSPDVRVFQLVIYDTKAEKTKTFCVNTITRVFKPVWSPTGNQLLVAGFFDNMANYGTIFIDVEKELLAQVKTEVIPVGWMLNP